MRSSRSRQDPLTPTATLTRADTAPASRPTLCVELSDEAVLARMDAVRVAARNNPRYAFDEPWSVFARRMRMLTPQSYGTRFQNRFAEHFGWKVIGSSLNRGDVLDEYGDHHEVKTTVITRSNTGVNFVQIRPHQDIAGYHLFVIQPNSTVVHFWLSKAQMNAEVARIGTSAHGTSSAVSANQTREYAIRFEWTPQHGDAARWMSRYWQDSRLPA